VYGAVLQNCTANRQNGGWALHSLLYGSLNLQTNLRFMEHLANLFYSKESVNCPTKMLYLQIFTSVHISFYVGAHFLLCWCIFPFMSVHISIYVGAYFHLCRCIFPFMSVRISYTKHQNTIYIPTTTDDQLSLRSSVLSLTVWIAVSPRHRHDSTDTPCTYYS
jgi:hypothetical protein